MIKLNDELLESVGLGSLTPRQKNQVLDQMYATLELRVGMRLAERMTEEQLAEFDRLIAAGVEEDCLAWLERECPDYRDVVGVEFDRLTDEVRGVAPALVESASQAA